MQRDWHPTALVTGGTDGIGKAIAVGLARQGFRLIIVGRDPDKGARAASELRTFGRTTEVQHLQADLSLLHEINRLADEVSKRCQALHQLILGAGAVRGRRLVTAEGYESMFALNYLGRFALTQRLLPLLEAGAAPSENARILLLSGAAQIGRIHFRDVHLTKNFSTIRAVAQFCRANDVFTLELARRLAGSKASSNISVVCLKIGVVKTNIRREFPMWMKILVPLLFDPLLAQPVSEVANSALRLLFEKQFEGPGGGLFLQIRRFRPLKPSRSLTDPDQGRQLFDLSEQLVLRATHGSSSAVPLYAAADTPGTVTLR